MSKDTTKINKNLKPKKTNPRIIINYNKIRNSNKCSRCQNFLGKDLHCAYEQKTDSWFCYQCKKSEIDLQEMRRAW